MKKQFLVPVLALAFAVTGAFASNRLADVYYPGGDSDCSETTQSTEVAPCEIGEDAPCLSLENGFQHYYKPNGTGACTPVTREL